MKCDPWNAERPLAASLLLTLALAAATRAQDGLEDVPEPADLPQVEAQQLLLAGDFLDNAIFGANRDPAAAKKWLETHLALRVDEIDRVCALSESQKARLALAGRGDIKRFFDRVEEVEARSGVKPLDPPRPNGNPRQHIARGRIVVDRAKLVDFQPEIRGLGTKFQEGIFDEGSIFAKTARHILSAEQKSLYEMHQKESMQFRHRSLVKLFVTAMEPTVALTADQRERLTEILVSEIPPRADSRPYDVQFINYLLSQIPEERLRPIFTDGQWPKVEQFRIKGRADQPQAGALIFFGD